MSSSEFRASGQSSVRLSVIAAGLLCATAVAGCSADIARLDMANLGFSDSPHNNNSAPIPSQPMRSGRASDVSDAGPTSAPYSYNPSPSGGSGSRVEPIRQAGLPDPVSSPALPPPRSSIAAQPQPEPRYGAPASSSGKVIEVAAGDTLYSLARRHGVPISSLMSANGLQKPTIFPGQKLTLPTDGRRHPPAHRHDVAGRSSTPVAHRPAPMPRNDAVAEEPRAGGASYTVAAGDSLYSIARRNGVRVADIQAANGISDPTRLRPGMVLRMPGSGAAAAARPEPSVASAPPEPTAPVPPAVAKEAQADLTPGISTRPRIINTEAEPVRAQPERVAVAAPRTPVMNDASPSPDMDKPTSAAVVGKFRWPARGRIVAGFGRRPDHTHNDGINILVPQGASVHAAEGGTVAYAGSELKGYGNLILIRHEGNWISAYAHNDSLLVRRGDHVERGQEIAKAGKTGAVDQPQLHFELRQGSKPVDPVPHLER